MQPVSSRRIWRPYTQEKTAPPPIEITNGSGAYLYTKSGQNIFDGISSWWLITHGHCHPEIVEAVQRQAARLDQVTFANFTHRPAEELAALLIQMTPPELTRVFFTDNGSTAVEAALKMVLQACVQNGFPERQTFLTFEGAYHGDTVGAMSVSGKSLFNKPYRKTLFKVITAKHPTLSFMPAEEYTRDFETLIETHHRSLAGVIIEPLIQGAGGMIVWPEEAVRRVAKLCRKFGLYLIFDEVMTGFGRTGKMFAMDRLGIAPDVVCLSKGLTGGTLPLAVTLVSEDVYAAFLSENRAEMFFHGHSFTGNPISCAAAVANLKLFQKTDILRKLEQIESTHLVHCAEMQRTVPLRDARVCGTVAALTVKTRDTGYGAEFSAGVSQTALENGLFIRPLGNVVYLLPPYCSATGDLEFAWHGLRKAILAHL